VFLSPASWVFPALFRGPAILHATSSNCNLIKQQQQQLPCSRIIPSSPYKPARRLCVQSLTALLFRSVVNTLRIYACYTKAPSRNSHCSLYVWPGKVSYKMLSQSSKKSQKMSKVVVKLSATPTCSAFVPGFSNRVTVVSPNGGLPLHFVWPTSIRLCSFRRSRPRHVGARNSDPPNKSRASLRSGLLLCQDRCFQGLRNREYTPYSQRLARGASDMKSPLAGLQSHNRC
jgi:hypothetical protein